MRPDAIRVVATEDLSAEERAAVRVLLDAAFEGDFTDDDWQHALGGWHALVQEGESVIAHGSVVERHIVAGGQVFRAGYVEAVAVMPGRQRQGLGSAILRTLTRMVCARYDLGVLSTGEWVFYERLGWERWRGPTLVRTRNGRLLRTHADDDSVMVLRCARSAGIDVTAPIACDERAGDSW